MTKALTAQCRIGMGNIVDDDRMIRKVLGENMMVATARMFLILGVISVIGGTIAWLIGP